MGGAVGRGSAAKAVIRCRRAERCGRWALAEMRWWWRRGVDRGRRSARGARSRRSTVGREGVRYESLGRERVSAAEERWTCSRIAAPVSANPQQRLLARHYWPSGAPGERRAQAQISSASAPSAASPLPAGSTAHQRRRALLPPTPALRPPAIREATIQRRSICHFTAQFALVWRVASSVVACLACLAKLPSPPADVGPRSIHAACASHHVGIPSHKP
jgi:hypothetical protein